MTGWIIFLSWFVGFVATCRRVGWLAAEDMSDGREWTVDDIVFGVFVGFFVGLVWPIVVPISALVKRGVFFSPPRRAKLKELQRRIAELERETHL